MGISHVKNDILEESASRAASYYHDLTIPYVKYSGGTFGWHYGIWRDGVRSHPESLIESNQMLVEGLSLDASSHVLDSGCGMGAFAVWLASRYRCQVTGITVSPLHVRMANMLATMSGVDSLCQFLVMDMNGLNFENSQFDYIFNQETSCYVVDKKSYLKNIYRLLKPGGQWRAQEFAVSPQPLSPRMREKYEVVCQGFHIPSFLSSVEMGNILNETGFQSVEINDVTHWTAPTARFIIRHSLGTMILMKLRLDWMVFSRDPGIRQNAQGHFQAGVAFSRGLLKRSFRMLYLRGSKPI